MGRDGIRSLSKLFCTIFQPSVSVSYPYWPPRFVLRGHPLALTDDSGKLPFFLRYVPCTITVKERAVTSCVQPSVSRPRVFFFSLFLCKEAKLIVVVTKKGYMARLVAKFRPNVPVS